MIEAVNGFEVPVLFAVAAFVWGAASGMGYCWLLSRAHDRALRDAIERKQ